MVGSTADASGYSHTIAVAVSSGWRLLLLDWSIVVVLIAAAAAAASVVADANAIAASRAGIQAAVQITHTLTTGWLTDWPSAATKRARRADQIEREILTHSLAGQSAAV